MLPKKNDTVTRHYDIFLLILVCCMVYSCTSAYKGKECVDVREIVWNCQSYCENSEGEGITDPMACKGGCWLISEYAKPLFREIVSIGMCVEPDYTTRCCVALDEALRECMDENREVMTWDVETGVFKFVHDLENRCFELSLN